MKLLLAGVLMATAAHAQMRTATLPGKSPLIVFRIVFTAGSAADPADKPGLAYITAQLLANGGTREMTYKQIVDALYPMAASVSAQVDKEMTAFSGSTHIDNLQAYYKLLRTMLLDPGWREDDFRRVKDDAINFLRVSLRSNNDEELGKEVLYETLYRGTPYGHYSVGTVSSIQSLTLDDVKSFYRNQYSQSKLILGIAGGYPASFLEAMQKDFRKLRVQAGLHPRPKAPSVPAHTTAVIVDKDTRSVAYSLGFPIPVTRSHPDYPALLLATSYLGQHRDSGGRLYNRLRETRGLNYGDYAYIEYFPRGMFRFEPDPNLARRFQIFQIWIRPVEPPTAKFALRLALYEFDRFVKEGLSQEDFERWRDFVTKYINLLTKTKSAELGYLIDSMYYGVPNYAQLIRKGMAKLTRAEVNRAIQRHLRKESFVIVAVAKNATELKAQLAGDAPSPMAYNAPKPEAITQEDKTVQAWPLGLRPENITVVPVAKVFE